jgi:outer membrane protein assembly factor BamB
MRLSTLSLTYLGLGLLVSVGLDSLSSRATRAAAHVASNWPQFRGPGSQGVSEEVGLPVEWGADKNIRWKTPIAGRGHSSPIVWGRTVFLTSAIQGLEVPGAVAVKHKTAKGDDFLHPDSIGAEHSHSLHVIAIDANTGRELWKRTAYEGRVFDNRHRKNTYASSTPVTDGEHLYAYFGAEGIYCYDFSGTLSWKASLGPIATMGMGVGSSPALFDGLVIVQCDQDNGQGSFLVALDKLTGKQVWKTSRDSYESWSTPVIARSSGRTELIVNSREWIISYDPQTGTERWRCKGVGNNPVPTPLVGHGMIFASAGAGEKLAIGVRLGGNGDLTNTSSVAWRYNKGTAHVASPILYENFLYLMTDSGILTCLNARSGDVVYEGGRVPVPATFVASPVAYEGKILLTSEDGDTFVVKAGSNHEILRTNSLGEPVFASIAISRGSLFIRAEKNLYCIGR